MPSNSRNLSRGLACTASTNSSPFCSPSLSGRVYKFLLLRRRSSLTCVCHFLAFRVNLFPVILRSFCIFTLVICLFYVIVVAIGLRLSSSRRVTLCFHAIVVLFIRICHRLCTHRSTRRLGAFTTPFHRHSIRVVVVICQRGFLATRTLGACIEGRDSPCWWRFRLQNRTLLQGSCQFSFSQNEGPQKGRRLSSTTNSLAHNL